MCGRMKFTFSSVSRTLILLNDIQTVQMIGMYLFMFNRANQWRQNLFHIYLHCKICFDQNKRAGDVMLFMNTLKSRNGMISSIQKYVFWRKNFLQNLLLSGL